MKNSDKPAFPPTMDDPNYIEGHKGWCYGMTKREYFAIQCLNGMLSDPDRIGNESQLSKRAVEYADELLKQLEA